MASATEQEEAVVHILWINAGLSCDGDSVALTAATQPSIEEIALGALPGLPDDALEVVRLYASRDREAVHAYHAASSLELWLRELGLRWKLSDHRAAGSTRKGPTSAEKWIPESVFEFGDEEIARFLAALWDCDGHVDRRSVFYKTISRRLAIDVQTLLLRLGIRSVIYQSTYAASDAGRPAASPRPAPPVARGRRPRPGS